MYSVSPINWFIRTRSKYLTWPWFCLFYSNQFQGNFSKKPFSLPLSKGKLKKKIFLFLAWENFQSWVNQFFFYSLRFITLWSIQFFFPKKSFFCLNFKKRNSIIFFLFYFEFFLYLFIFKLKTSKLVCLCIVIFWLLLKKWHSLICYF